MDEEDLIRNEMSVKLDLSAGREVFVPHHQFRGPTILAIDFEDEGTLAGVPAHASLSLADL
jgi:hypothetical protein